MLESAEDGVSYAVEVKYSDDERARWITRYGWFPEVPREYEKTDGLARAMINLQHVRENESSSYPVSRIVKRTTSVEVLDL